MHADILETLATESELHNITGALASPQTRSVLPSLACFCPPPFPLIYHMIHQVSGIFPLHLCPTSQ